MSEITFGGGDDDGGDSGGGGSFDITDTMNQVEEAMERIQNNPKLAKMLGIDLEMDSLNDVETDDDGNVDIDADFLLDMVNDLCGMGYGDKTLNEVGTELENNKAVVNQMIQQQVGE